MPASATSKWGLNGEERAALLRVRTGPKCPEGNRRELLWDTNLNSGTAKEREKINRPNTLPAVCRTKGLSKSRGASRLRTRPSPPEAGGKGEGKGANSAPEMASPYHTVNRPPVSNQRLPEILDGRHPPGGSWLNTRRMHPTGNWVWGNWGWGRGGEKGHRARGECARQAPGCLSFSGWGRHKTQVQWSPRFPGVPENWNRTPRRVRSIYSSQESQQRRRGEHTPVSGANPVWLEHCECSPHTQRYLPAAHRPSRSRTELANLNNTTSARLCQDGN